MADHDECGEAQQGDLSNDKRGRHGSHNMSPAAKKAIIDYENEQGKERERNRAKGYKGPERRGGGSGVGDTGGPASSGPSRGNGKFF